MIRTYNFPVLVYPEETLNRFARQARRALFNEPIALTYPSAVCRKHPLEVWVDRIPEIRAINSERLSSVRGKAGVYGVFVAKGQQDWKLKYVGTANGSGSLQRLNNHLLWRNRVTPSGKFTNCKFENVREEIQRRCLLAFSFVEIEPAELRHFVENYIQRRDKPEWNHHGTAVRKKRSYAL